jgi:hypothetical protein
MTPDVLIENEGTIVMFQPVTDAARDWFSVNVQTEGWQWFGTRLAVDHRMAGSLIEGLLSEGFNLN